MKEVKERQHMKAPKLPDPARRAPRAARAYSRVSEQIPFTEEGYDSPSGYAEGKAEEYAGDAVRQARQAAEGAARAARDCGDTVSEQAGERLVENTPRQQEGGTQHAAEPLEGRPGPARAQAGPVPGEGTAVRTGAVRTKDTTQVQAVKQIPKGTVKDAAKGVKDTGKTVKTAEALGRNAGKTAKTAEKAAVAAKEAAGRAGRAAAKAAAAAARAAAATVKAAVAAVKELIAALAAGGGAAGVMILIAALAAALIASCFGLFWSNDASSGRPMSAIIAAIDRAYESGIESEAKRLEDTVSHDEAEVVYKGDNNDGDSVAVYNWNDVLAVYAVLYTTGEDPAVLIEPSDETERRLGEVFRAMNRATLTYETRREVPEGAPGPTPDADGNTPEPEKITVLTITVRQYAMTYKEAAVHYHFDDSQLEMLEEMMSPAYYSYYASLIGVDVYGGTDYTQIISNLPPNSKGAEVVKAALTRLGCPYVWGAKGSTKFDCSGLAYWSIHEVDRALGDRMYTNAAGQAKYCYDRGLTVGRSELQPGDLVFWVNKRCEGCHRWKEIHHVGIYIGEGKVVEAASGKGRVLIRDLWETKNYPILMFGRPYQ